MLPQEIKEQISHSYSRIRALIPQFVPRKEQNFLIAELAKTLAGEYEKKNRIMVAEAGTGVGKSLAYLLGSIPYGRFSNKKIIISTATISLQEQLYYKDLPLFQQIYEHECNIVLAKGRQRYCCSHKLALIADSAKRQSAQELFFDFKPSIKDLVFYQQLYTALSKGKWNGDRDNWPKPIPDKVWQQIVAEKYNCHAGFHSHRDCPLVKAREKLSQAHIIITNHSLLMADLELGGVILFEPEKTIYIIDEAHHLPKIARDFSAVSSSLLGSANWLEKLNQASFKLACAADIKQSSRFLNILQTEIQSLIPSLRGFRDMLKNLPLTEDNQYRFEHGILPEHLNLETNKLKISTNNAYKALKKLHDQLLEQVKLKTLPITTSEFLLEESAYFLHRLEALSKMWEQMAQPSSEKGPPLARWISQLPEAKNDFLTQVSPIEVGARLNKLLWSRAAGVGLFSATLRSMNNFHFFCKQAGLNESSGIQFIALPSPFNYAQNATLHIPKMAVEPQHQAFTAALPKLILTYLKDQTASLVLFSSYWQMNEVAKNIRSEMKTVGDKLLIQGEKPRNLLIEEHIKRLKKGEISILFGTNSFSEGLDLPGDLLTNLIITKIPFSVPTSPIEEAHAEYISQQGGNPFLQLSLPETSRKLVQSVGRLLRKEQDTGRIILLDRRIITKKYGKALLNALPPFTLRLDD